MARLSSPQRAPVPSRVTQLTPSQQTLPVSSKLTPHVHFPVGRPLRLQRWPLLTVCRAIQLPALPSTAPSFPCQGQRSACVVCWVTLSVTCMVQIISCKALFIISVFSNQPSSRASLPTCQKTDLSTSTTAKPRLRKPRVCYTSVAQRRGLQANKASRGMIPNPREPVKTKVCLFLLVPCLDPTPLQALMGRFFSHYRCLNAGQRWCIRLSTKRTCQTHPTPSGHPLSARSPSLSKMPAFSALSGSTRMPLECHVPNVHV